MELPRQRSGDEQVSVMGLLSTEAFDEAVERATDALLADSGLPRFGGHRATVERRVRIAFDAAGIAVATERADHWKREYERVNARAFEHRAEIERLRAEVACLSTAGGR